MLKTKIINIGFKALLIASIAALLGLPLNTLSKVLMFAGGLVLVIKGQLLDHRKVIVVIITTVMLLAVLVDKIFPALQITEGHNVVLINSKDNIYSKNLPEHVANHIANKFQQNYALQHECDHGSFGSCWQNYLPENKIYAFSAESFWQNTTASRQVSDINISNRNNVRIGAFNDIRYNFFNPPDNNINREQMPFFIAYKFPTKAIGMKLYWQGELLWPDSNGNYTAIYHDKLQSQKITADIIDKEIYVMGLSPDKSPVVKIAKGFYYNFIDLFKLIGALIGIWFLLLSVRYPSNKISIYIIFGLLGIQLLYLAIFARPILSGSPILTGGGDGLVFYGYARDIVQHIISGNFLEALRGSEGSFYYMPGLRYLRALELILFGDTSYGYLLFTLFIPVIFYKFLRTIFTRTSTMLLLGLFFIPWMKFFGFANTFYVKHAITGYGETLAYGLILTAFWLIFSKKDYTTFEYRWSGFWASLLLALAVFVRPNLLIISGFLILGGLVLNNQLSLRNLLIVSLGFSPILFMGWHNLYFGDELSLLTSNKSLQANIMTSPMVYFSALVDLSKGVFVSDNLQAVKEHLYLWNRWVYFFRIPTIIIALYCIFTPKISGKIRLLSLLGITMHLQMMVFNPKIRYATLAWSFCFVSSCYIIATSARLSKFYFFLKFKIVAFIIKYFTGFKLTFSK